MSIRSIRKATKNLEYGNNIGVQKPMRVIKTKGV
jgi:hypothetical protein